MGSELSEHEKARFKELHALSFSRTSKWLADGSAPALGRYNDGGVVYYIDLPANIALQHQKINFDMSNYASAEIPKDMYVRNARIFAVGPNIKMEDYIGSENIFPH